MPTLPPAHGAESGRFRKGFVHAFRGLGFVVRTQVNARFHAAATVIVVGAGFCFGISRGEWLALIVATGLVWTAEALNTAIEAVVDLVSPEYHPLAGRAKDAGAGAVLCAACAAACIGVLVFGPKFLALVRA